MRYAMRWAPLYARYGALAGYLLAAAVIAVGWLGRDQRNIDAEQGLGYALGLAGGLSMLVLLLYPCANGCAHWRPSVPRATGFAPT